MSKTLRTRFSIARPGFSLQVDESLPATGVTSIFGPSGCGKTTWLRAIAGLERPSSGLCRFGDEVWQDGETFLPAHRRPVGYVFQDGALFPHMDVRANLEYGLPRHRPAARDGEAPPAFDEVVEMLRLAPLLSRRPASLSGGEAQRVAIGRALLGAPRLLLMDEPLSALDAEARRDILSLLEALRRRLSLPIVHVSHSRQEVARLADHLVLMERGKVRESGPLMKLWTRLDVARGHGSAASSVVEATVAGHQEEWGLTLLDTPAGTFTIASPPLAPGTRVRLRIMARDVSLTLRRQEETSILNIFPARVEAIAESGPAQALVRLDASGLPLLASLTRKSAAALGLAPGRPVFAQVKAVALL